MRLVVVGDFDAAQFDAGWTNTSGRPKRRAVPRVTVKNRRARSRSGLTEYDASGRCPRSRSRIRPRGTERRCAGDGGAQELLGAAIRRGLSALVMKMPREVSFRRTCAKTSGCAFSGRAREREAVAEGARLLAEIGKIARSGSDAELEKAKKRLMTAADMRRDVRGEGRPRSRRPGSCSAMRRRVKQVRRRRA